MAQWNKQAQNYRSQDSSLFEVVMVADQNGNPPSEVKHKQFSYFPS